MGRGTLMSIPPIESISSLNRWKFTTAT